MEKITGGQWSILEAEHHINYLELLAAHFGLQTYPKNESNVHIRFQLDNTTGVRILNHMGASHSDLCNFITVAESRNTNNASEWMLSPQEFKMHFDNRHSFLRWTCLH